MNPDAVKLRDDLPMPPTRKRGKPPHYPWREMEVGQSFEFLPHVKWGSARVLASRANAFLYPKRFTVRKIKTRHICWRVK